MRGALVALALVALAPGARAYSTDRVAVELRGNDGPLDAVVAFERACWKLGVEVDGASWLQSFDFAGARFERLAVSGAPELVRCLTALDDGRRAVDGTFTWADGFSGGLLVPVTGAEERVPDPRWIDPTARPAAPAPDAQLVHRLASGDPKALETLASRDTTEALADVAALADANTPRALPMLERIASTHPAWLVRRTAALLLSPTLSVTTFEQLAKTDAEWAVRLAAVDGLRAAAAGTMPGFANDVGPQTVLVDVALHDASWVVRREALGQLTSAAAAREKDALTRLAKTDAAPEVRAAALLVLAGAGLAKAGLLDASLADASPDVRAAAASVLAAEPDRDDVAKLWRAMNDQDRAVRLAATPMLRRLDDDTIAPDVWRLYEGEANRLDAEPGALATMERYLEREPFPALSRLVEARLAEPISPLERRLLARLLTHVDAPAATRRLVPLFDSKNIADRELAAYAAPAGSIANARRRALIRDVDADVRAAAVLGLCEVERVPRELVADVDLAPAGLGLEALEARQLCGMPIPQPPYIRTHLAGPDAEDGPSHPWPAVVAVALLFASVVGTKLRAKG